MRYGRIEVWSKRQLMSCSTAFFSLLQEAEHLRNRLLHPVEILVDPGSKKPLVKLRISPLTQNVSQGTDAVDGDLEMQGQVGRGGGVGKVREGIGAGG